MGRGEVRCSCLFFIYLKELEDFLMINYETHIQYPHKRYSNIDQHLARHFEYYGACLSSPPLFLCSQLLPLLKFNNIHQLGNRVVILVNCGTLIPLF